MPVINRNSAAPIYDTLADAIAGNMRVGQQCIVQNNTGSDDVTTNYKVVANGSGGIAMNNGNELLGFGYDKVDSIPQLPPATGSGRKVSVTGYHVDSTVGGGDFVDAGLARHNGGTIIDPNRAFPTDWTNSAQLTAWFADSGIDVNCWMRQGSNAETATLLNFGGIVDGVTDDLIPLQTLIDYAILKGFKSIEMSSNTSTTCYLSAKPQTFDPTFTIRFTGHVTILPLNNWPNATFVSDFTQAGNETSYSEVLVLGDIVDQPSIAGLKVNAVRNYISFGGSETRGGRHAANNVCVQTEPTAADNPDRNYVGVVGHAIGVGAGGDGGSPGAEKGALFGANLLCVTQNGYTDLMNVSAGEVNSFMLAGSSCRYHSLLQLVTGDQVKGSETDVALAISGFGGAVGLRSGISFTDANGASGIDAVSGTLIDSNQVTAVPMTTFQGIDLSAWSFSGAMINFDGFTVGSNGSMEVGKTSAPQNTFLDFHSSGNVNDYDYRILIDSGSASNGTGNASFIGANSYFNSQVRPGADNTYNLGSASFRWAEIFAANGTINTSDERLKTDICAIPDNVLDAWAKVPKRMYKWIDSKSEKGDEARWHFGVIAQDIVSSFEEFGLDATEYGLLCFDKWEAQTVVHDPVLIPKLDENGQPIPKQVFNPDGTPVVIVEEVEVISEDGHRTGLYKKVESFKYEPEMIEKEPGYEETIPAGERYGVRYDQAAVLDNALLTREISKLKSL